MLTGVRRGARARARFLWRDSELHNARAEDYQSSGAEPSMTVILNLAGNLLASIRSWRRGCGPMQIPSVRLCSCQDTN
jgi:hypothetical protein